MTTIIKENPSKMLVQQISLFFGYFRLFDIKLHKRFRYSEIGFISEVCSNNLRLAEQCLCEIKNKTYKL